MSEDKSRAERKAALRAEAAEKGVSYEELKQQKKDEKEKKKKKRIREAETLVTDDEKKHDRESKRMRSWSGEESDLKSNDSKRVRTRSMDAEEEKKSDDIETPAPTKTSSLVQTPDEWRKENNITVKQHGVRGGNFAVTDPYFKFTDAPFCHSIQRALTGAGFEKPTAIQSQVRPNAI